MRKPKYRNFRRQYGGDPDTSILRDLHKRMTSLEATVWQVIEIQEGLQTAQDNQMETIQRLQCPCDQCLTIRARTSDHVILPSSRQPEGQ